MWSCSRPGRRERHPRGVRPRRSRRDPEAVLAGHPRASTPADHGRRRMTAFVVIQMLVIATAPTFCVLGARSSTDCAIVEMYSEWWRITGRPPSFSTRADLESAGRALAEMPISVLADVLQHLSADTTGEARRRLQVVAHHAGLDPHDRAARAPSVVAPASPGGAPDDAPRRRRRRTSHAARRSPSLRSGPSDREPAPVGRRGVRRDAAGFVGSCQSGCSLGRSARADPWRFELCTARRGVPDPSA